MDNLANLESNTILIIPNNIRMKVLDRLSMGETPYNIKIMSFNDFKRGLLFDYTNEAIYSVMREYNINYGVSKSYINDLYTLKEEDYTEKKLKNLMEIKKFLDSKGLLIRDNLFGSMLKSKKKVYVFGFDYINKFNNYLLDLTKEYIDVEILEKDNKKLSCNVYNCQTLNKEIEFIAEKMADLIGNGVDASKIFIANYSNEYYFSFKRIFKEYNIPFYIKGETTLYTTSIGNYFINNLCDNLDLLLYKIRKHFDVNNNPVNESVYKVLSTLVNNYYWCDNILEIKDLIIEEMRNAKIPCKHNKKEIRTTNILDNFFDDDEYVFLIGFNLGSIPKLRKDEDYLNDAIKPDIIDKSYEYNKNIKVALLKALSNIKNLTITYKESSAFNSYYPSFLTDYPQFKVSNIEESYSQYSDNINKLNYAKSLDNLIKFNEQNELLPIYKNSYDIPYNSYSNAFTGLDEDALFKAIDNKIKFSYSNIIHYYKCPFMFYVSDILKVREFESTLDQFIGSLFHYTLEKCLDNDDNIDKVYDSYITEHKPIRTPKEEFFINTLRDEIHFVIDAIREQYKHSKHKEVWMEKEIEIPIKRKIQTTIKGFVDKILVCDKNVIIIDYKTSNSQTINKDYFEFGIDIQLPIYLYLLKQLDSNLEVTGLYLQHILNLDMKYEPNKDAISEKKKKLKLDGITFNDEQTISLFDDTYEKSEVIQSMKVTKSYGGIKNTNRILDVSARDEIQEIIEGLILNCIDKVVEAEFDIRPIDIDYGQVNGCKFCEYRDICYRRVSDFNKVITSKGDEENE
ncbi:MAG: PD-(D/E)XK nuclease family protein [Bacilli bacterium]|nr:PD-(D/E)XK nuclease family protein [Bacilli bacterium]